LGIHNDFIILDSELYAKDDFIGRLERVIQGGGKIGTASPFLSCDVYNILFGQKIDEQNCEENLQTMVSQPCVIYIKWEAWEKIRGFNTNIISPYYVIIDFQLKVLKNGYRNIISVDAFVGSDSTMSVMDISGETYTHDMGIMESTWGMHYFNVAPNHNLVSLIEGINSDDIKNILEIGCDCGATLMAIKNVHTSALLYGIELNENAVGIAKSFANVICGNIETDGISFDGVKFDVIIFGDVLEHLKDPESIIKMCKEHLSDNGRIICSIPNVQHISVLRQLIYGRFTYTETGLLDKTHIHLFTKYEILKMFENAGYSVEIMLFNQFPISNEEQEMVDKLKNTFPDIEEQGMKAFQYLVCAKKNF
jgi:2-polyprenyl-3-methyl-5-hydroxy-6-metoxy-1,4-benzoquinol methylase